MNTRTFFKSLVAFAVAPFAAISAANPEANPCTVATIWPQYVLVSLPQIGAEWLIHPKDALKLDDCNIVGHRHKGKTVRYSEPGHPWHWPTTKWREIHSKPYRSWLPIEPEKS